MPQGTIKKGASGGRGCGVNYLDSETCMMVTRPPDPTTRCQSRQLREPLMPHHAGCDGREIASAKDTQSASDFHRRSTRTMIRPGPWQAGRTKQTAGTLSRKPEIRTTEQELIGGGGASGEVECPDNRHLFENDGSHRLMAGWLLSLFPIPSQTVDIACTRHVATLLDGSIVLRSS